MSPADPTTIRDTIIDALLASGMTQTKLAQLSGWQRSKLSVYLAGKGDANGESLDRLCRALSLDPGKMAR